MIRDRGRLWLATRSPLPFAKAQGRGCACVAEWIPSLRSGQAFAHQQPGAVGARAQDDKRGALGTREMAEAIVAAMGSL